MANKLDGEALAEHGRTKSVTVRCLRQRIIGIVGAILCIDLIVRPIGSRFSQAHGHEPLWMRALDCRSGKPPLQVGAHKGIII